MYKLIVGMGTCGISAGAKATYDKLTKLLAQEPVEAEIAIAGCLGMCYREPLLEVRNDKSRVIYGQVDSEVAEQIYRQHIMAGQIVDSHVILQIEDNEQAQGQDSDYMAEQHRIVLRNCGVIDPENIDEYRARDGYDALRKALAMEPQQIIAQIKESGLRGRGGGGFPTGLKWQFAASHQADHKYVICNADEGDPGAFMDRSVLESDPHAVLEGMAICAYAIGADFGYIYCRAEYPLAIKRLKIAITQAKEHNCLGNNIFGSDFSFNIKIKEGAGAFVCGEETALMASIEGHRGMPRIRPPFPAEKGLWQKPTNINNVETLANIPWIIRNGADQFNAIGTEKSKGSKVFALAGKINRGGLVEVPMGITIRKIVEHVGGGIKGNRKFKAVQMGGPSGGCIPEHLADIAIDYENVTKTGAIMGSGGLVVMDDSICMVEVARFFLEFTKNESCGKCTFCRIGTVRMLEILERITLGEGKIEDIAKLRSLASQIKDASLCGLGQTAPNPVLTTLQYYQHEYEAHINDHICPAKYCSALVDYVIDPEKCVGCTLCAKNCPVEAIYGEAKQPHTVDPNKCVKCGKCITSCNFDAIYKA